MFCIVREVDDSKLSIKRKLKALNKQNSSTSVANKHCLNAHRSYGNPFGKKQFLTSESAMTDKAFVERRQMVNA